MDRRHCGPLKMAPDGELRRPGPAETPFVYTVAEVAARLKVSAGTVRNMIDQGLGISPLGGRVVMTLGGTAVPTRGARRP